MTLPQGFRCEMVTAGETEQVPMYVTALTPLEARTLRELLAQVIALMRHEDNASDPAVARLVPDMYPDDEQASKQLREYTERSLRKGKEKTAAQVLDTIPVEGGEVCLTSEEAHTWMLALTDIRLIVGTRLEIDDDTDLVAELDEAVLKDPTGPRVYAITVYHYTSFLQESLVCAVTGGMDRDLDKELAGFDDDDQR